MSLKKKVGLAVAALLTTVSVSACGVLPGLTVEQIPLPAPGGIGDAMTVHTSFENALNLPNKAKVRLGGMDVGEVESIVAENYRAIVTMKVAKDTKLPIGSCIPRVLPWWSWKTSMTMPFAWSPSTGFCLAVTATTCLMKSPPLPPQRAPRWPRGPRRRRSPSFMRERK